MAQHRHRILTVALILLAGGIVPVVGQPLTSPFEFVIPSWDSSASAWLPEFPSEPAGEHGFVRASASGHLEFDDGTPVRFVGASIILTGCFPDSVTAIVTARHLRKFGVNLVRFNYFDYHNYNGASTLAPSSGPDAHFDGLSASQMARLDWFIYQLKENGIYTHFVLKSRQGPRAGDGVPNYDSVYYNGQYIALFSEPIRKLHKDYLTAFLSHVNPYTGVKYVDDPAVALMTIIDQNSLYDAWIGDRLRQRSGVLSYHQARLLDTLYASYLKAKYGSTSAIREAYYEGLKSDGPNTIKNGGFESFTDNWTLTVGEGAQANLVAVEGPNVAPGEGQYSLRVAVRKVSGVEGRLYLDQVGLPVRRDGIYRLDFKAKTDSASGRQIRLVLLRGGTSLGLNQTIDLTNSWKSYSITFRALDTDSLTTVLRTYMGKQMGDVFLDAVSLHETGREGLEPGETIEASTIGRAQFNEVGNYALRRVYDLTAFYDSLERSYYQAMYDHLKSLGVHVPIAATNLTAGSADTRIQAAYDFTGEYAQWDYPGTRPGESGYSDSTWVIRNYSVLNYRDQKIPEFSRNAIVGKPFVAEGYNHIYPNIHRSEMMIFYPAYASLHDWDGAYFYLYTDRSTEMADRRRIISNDFSAIMADPSIMALMPQAAAIMRNRWIAPAERSIAIQHDKADLDAFPLVYPGRGLYQIDGSFNNVVNLLSAVRIDSFDARRHYTAGDYYFTTPTDDNIQSDTREILLDMTKGVISISTPKAEGGSGVLENVSALRTGMLGVNWIGGGRHVTYLWTSLDTAALENAGRSLLTITTRAANVNAQWQFGDSSLGKNWGVAPVMMESAKIGINFYTDADTILLYPLDTMARPDGRVLGAVRTPMGAWRIIIDLASEKTPWFGVEQRFGESPLDVPHGDVSVATVGEIQPNPAHDEASLELRIPEGGAPLTVRLYDVLGRLVSVVADGRAVDGRSVLPIDLHALVPGSYVCDVRIGDRIFIRRFVVR